MSREPRIVRKRSFWHFSAAEVRVHAAIVAVVSCVVAITVLALGTAYRDPFGQLKWNDFVHFYTLGDIARRGPISDLYDAQAQHQHQVALVPDSAPELYLPVYPPQIALVFAPLSTLPYHIAAVIWALVSTVVYAASVRIAWRTVRSALTNASLVALCAAAFPPFWSLILNGQTTAVPIVAFTGGAIALSRDRRFLAGVAFGLLLVKPPFGLVLAVVVVVCREWAILAGLAVSACIQLALVLAVLGNGALVAYLHVVSRLESLQGALEPSVTEMHSLAVVTRLLPGGLSIVGWLFATVVVSWMTVRVWRSAVPMYVRTATLVMGSVLVNPHLNLYDAAVLAAPLVSLSGWIELPTESLAEVRHRWRLGLYALFTLLLCPTARLIGLQLSPFVLLFLMYIAVVTTDPRRAGWRGSRPPLSQARCSLENEQDLGPR